MLDKIVKGLFGTEKKEEIPVQPEELYEEFDTEGMEDDELLISQILGDAETNVEQLDAFKEYLNEKLIFPFSAEYCSDLAGAIPDDATVNVLKMHGTDEEYGIMVVIKYENEMHTVPLYDLVVEDEDADNYDALEIYSIWFDNKEV
jgi:Calcium binding